MNENSKQQPIDPELEARIAAMVLGEASATERDLLDHLIGQRPELAALKAHYESVDGLLREVGSGEAVENLDDWKLPQEKRDAVLSVIRGDGDVEPANGTTDPLIALQMPRRWMSLRTFANIAALFLVIGTLVGLIVPSVQMARKSRSASSSFARDELLGEMIGGVPLNYEMEAESSSESVRSENGLSVQHAGKAIPKNETSESDFSAKDPAGALSKIRDSLGIEVPRATPYYDFNGDDDLDAPASPTPELPDLQPQRSLGRLFRSRSAKESPEKQKGRLGSWAYGGRVDGERDFDDDAFSESGSAGNEAITGTATFDTPLGDTSDRVAGGGMDGGGVAGGGGFAVPTESFGMYDERVRDFEAAPIDLERQTGQDIIGDFAVADQKASEFMLRDEEADESDDQRDLGLLSDLYGTSASGPTTNRPNRRGLDRRPAVLSKIPQPLSEEEPSSDAISLQSRGRRDGIWVSGVKRAELETLKESIEQRSSQFQPEWKEEQGVIIAERSDRGGTSVDALARKRKLEERFGRKLRLPEIAPKPVAVLNELDASKEAFSTFSLHVSDVSFKLASAALAGGQWPDAAKIRIEEFVNAFDYGDPMPCHDEKVTCVVEQAAHPFLQQRNVLRVSMRTAAAGRASETPLRLTLLLDNSGSMERRDRRETVRLAFAALSRQLKPIDQVTLISFARQPRLLADKVSGSKSQQLVELVDQLPSEGGTNIEAALQLAFEKAMEQKLEDSQNRIVLLTDGAVNLGDANPESLSTLITTIRENGIAFDAAGISAEGLNDEVLEAMTRKGDGRYYLLDSTEDADDGFAQQIAGALRPSAKNVKVQVEFNPDRVGRYKLLGFEKHRLKTKDFRNDKVDAAEMAAAEAGVAVYQLEAKPDGQGDVGSVSVRFRDLSTGEMVEKRWPIPYQSDAVRLEQAAPSLRVATAAAMFAAKLKGGPSGEAVDLKTLSSLVSGLPEPQRDSKRVEQLGRMIQQARQIQK